MEQDGKKDFKTLIDINTISFNIMNTDTGINYKLYIKKDDEWCKENLYKIQNDFSQLYQILNDCVNNDSSEFKYDLSEESDSAFWIRSTMTPTFAKGASILVGFNSDDDLIYGLGFKCSDKCFLSSELSAEGDKLIRVSYSF